VSTRVDDSPSPDASSGAPRGDAPTEAPRTYEAAAARVEEIIRRLDSGEASLNETLALIAEGKALIEQCANELSAVGDALEELRLDELVARLSAEAEKP
jgi:exodeoxyribonuclease VII small subunit